MVRVCDSCQNLKMTKTSQFCSIHQEKLVSQVYIRIWSFWLTFTALQWMKINFKISQFSRFLLRPEYFSHVKIWIWLKLLNSAPFIMKTLVNHVYIRIWSSWLTFIVLRWMKTNFKISQFFKFSAKLRLCDFGQNLIMTKTS